MITSAEVLAAVKTALSTDTAITAWSNANFGRSHSVYVDIDERNPPNPDTDYPVIVIFGLDRTCGSSVKEYTWDLSLGVGVLNDAISVDANVSTMVGFGQAIELREMAENAIYSAGLGDVTTSPESSSSGFYPVFVCGSTIPIKLLKSNRRAMPI